MACAALLAYVATIKPQYLLLVGSTSPKKDSFQVRIESVSLATNASSLVGKATYLITLQKEQVTPEVRKVIGQWVLQTVDKAATFLEVLIPNNDLPYNFSAIKV